MTYKDLMVKSLTDLLVSGETLIHPIYGVLNQGNKQYYGFFGFTKKYLLIALMSGKQITYITRIPLDIKSIRIKQTAVFKQFVIDIAFNDGAPCSITASPKVLMIDSQKDNLPQFLNYLKSKSPVNRETELKDSDGKKIRWQYFNTFIYVMLAFFPMSLVVIIVMGLKENNLDLVEMLEAIPTALIIWGVFLVPLIILSLLNRFLFGKIVGVVRDDGLLLENNFITWKQIQKITFNPSISSRFKVSYTYASFFIKSDSETEYTFDIMHFPMYGLRKIKKYNPEIKIKLGKDGFFTILFIALLPTLISIIIPLFM